MRKLRKLLLMEKHVCPWWFAYTFDNPLRRLLHPPAQILAGYVEQGMAVADIGCGMGHFALEMARRVGAEGKVLAVDLQEKMLSRVRKRAASKGVADRIFPHLCSQNDLGVHEQVDFVLTFWMVHEVPRTEAFMEQIHGMLKDRGKWLIVEPRGHTSYSQFKSILERAEDSGFRVLDQPSIRVSYGAVLEKLP